MPSSIKIYQTLELIPDSDMKPKLKQRRWWRLEQLWKFLTQPKFQSPVVWKTKDGQWNVYEPMTGRTEFSMSDQVFKGWFESRYFWS